jgi:uracil phosphoribosyltransferase
LEILGQPIEALFSRKPARPSDTYVFEPFSPEERQACRRALSASARFVHHGLEDSSYDALTTMPPAFALPEDHPELFQRQAAFDRQFAAASEKAASGLVSRVLPRLGGEDPVVIVPVWRAGLCFAGTPSTEQIKYMHIGARRDPVTLKSSFYHSSALSVPDDGSARFLVCDPMIGTANAMIGVLEGLKSGLGRAYVEERIHVLGLFVTPEAAVRLLDRFPGINLHAATIDNHLNERGWVISDDSSRFLGDFGDCYVPAGLSQPRVDDMHKCGILDDDSLRALQKRLGR